MTTDIPQHIYHTPQGRRIKMAATNFTGLVLISVVMGLLFGYSISLTACIIIAGVLYVSSGQKIMLYPDRLIQKVPLGKVRVFKFSEGDFSLKKISGLEAWIMYLKSHGRALCYTYHATGRKISLALLISDEDVLEIHQKIQDYVSPSSS